MQDSGIKSLFHTSKDTMNSLLLYRHIHIAIRIIGVNTNIATIHIISTFQRQFLGGILLLKDFIITNLSRITLINQKNLSLGIYRYLCFDRMALFLARIVSLLRSLPLLLNSISNNFSKFWTYLKQFFPTRDLFAPEGIFRLRKEGSAPFFHVLSHIRQTSLLSRPKRYPISLSVR